MRDLVRVRGDLMADLKRAKQRLLAMLLRHGRIWRTSKYWTAEHRRWLGRQSFEDPALQAAFGHYRVALTAREAEMAAIEAELLPWAHRDPLGETVAKLTAYRGVGELSSRPTRTRRAHGRPRSPRRWVPCRDPACGGTWCSGGARAVGTGRWWRRSGRCAGGPGRPRPWGCAGSARRPPPARCGPPAGRPW